MVKKLSCGSCGSLKRFPHTFTIDNQYLQLSFQILVIQHILPNLVDMMNLPGKIKSVVEI